MHKKFETKSLFKSRAHVAIALVIISSGLLLVSIACGGSETVVQTVEVQRIVEVEHQVVQTVIVEKEVPLPGEPVVEFIEVEKVVEVERPVIQTVVVEKQVEVAGETVVQTVVVEKEVAVEVDVIKEVEKEVVVESAAPAATAQPAAAAKGATAPTAVPAAQSAPAPTPVVKSVQPQAQSQPGATQFQNTTRSNFALTSQDDTSTFSLDTDRTSFQLALNWTRAGYDVDPASVRAEEWINAFNYGYELPRHDDSFNIKTDVIEHPLDNGLHLARVAFQAPELHVDLPVKRHSGSRRLWFDGRWQPRRDRSRSG